MKFSQTIVALVTSLTFINIAFSIPLTSKTDSIDLITENIVGGIAVPSKVPNYSTSAEGSLPKRQTQQALQDILRDMNDVISNLGANNRAEFPKKLVERLFYYNGLYNYVVCHAKHTYHFQGTRGIDWVNHKFSFQNYEYEIVIGNAGRFTRYGADTPTNWYYSRPYVRSVTNSGGATTVVFSEYF